LRGVENQWFPLTKPAAATAQQVMKGLFDCKLHWFVLEFEH